MDRQLANKRADEILAYIMLQTGYHPNEATLMHLKQRLVLTIMLNNEIKQDFINTLCEALTFAHRSGMNVLTALSLYGVVC